MIGFYVVFIGIILFVAYAGIENTIKLFTYIDLEFRYRWILLRSYSLRHKLEQQLGIVPTSLLEHVVPEGYKND